MIDLNTIQKIYFIGIGGIGMSAIARYFKFQGKDVSGYDKTETALTKQLVEEDIPVHYDDDVELAPKDAQLVVYTPAVPKDHAEMVYYQQNHYPVFKRSDVLGMITSSSFNICVAGPRSRRQRPRNRLRRICQQLRLNLLIFLWQGAYVCP